ncbi:MAG: PCYCGC domain-containing protein [Gemmatimonadetes bacterium]|nr:PCYCGC domain-containing protein [Gemmatimonadota bacterium]
MTQTHQLQRLSRRRFLTRILAGLGATLVLGGGRPLVALARGGPAGGRGAADRPEHPEPRPGIDASNVLGAEALADTPRAIPIYDGVRAMPHIADGLRCYCGCAEWEGYRSLLTCFEQNGMARHCDGCLSEAELAHRRWKEGQSLAQIRRAVDARFAPRGRS